MFKSLYGKILNIIIIQYNCNILEYKNIIYIISIIYMANYKIKLIPYKIDI